MMCARIFNATPFLHPIMSRCKNTTNTGKSQKEAAHKMKLLQAVV
jgi:hypothetical protein